jgi:hypothetical protein
MKQRSNDYGGTVRAKCRHCLYTKPCHRVSAKLYPPEGGHLCEDCLITACIKALADEAAKPPPAPKDTRPYIQCPECRRVSYNPNDIKLGYCGNCAWFTSDPIMRKVKKEDRGG